MSALTVVGGLAGLRVSRFAVVGAVGTGVNLLVMWLVLAIGGHYLVAAVVAAQVSILHNFVLQERFVYRDVAGTSRASRLSRCAMFVGFNNVEAVVRLPVLALLVSGIGLPPVVAQAFTLAGAFVLRFRFVSDIVYRPHLEPVRTVITEGGHP